MFYVLSLSQSKVVLLINTLICKGGAESFKDKRRFFYKALQAHHGKNKTTQTKNVIVEVNRRNILDSVSYHGLKWLHEKSYINCSKLYEYFSVLFCVCSLMKQQRVFLYRNGADVSI